MKLRNIVLDMGNVMLVYNPELFIRREGITDPEDAELLRREIYGSREWPMMDAGILDEDDMAEMVLPRLPQRLRGTGDRLIHRWMEPVIPVEGMAELVHRLRDAGYHIYLLSNASRFQHVYWETVPGHEAFEGTVISADIRQVKPEPAIYRHLLEKFELKAEESLFVDDILPNVEGARQVGMLGFHFRGDAKALEDMIHEMEKDCPGEAASCARKILDGEEGRK